MNIQCFCVNPFYENTYLIWENPAHAVILDPGFYTPSEETEFLDFLDSRKLELKEIWLTHAHIDHIFGLEFLYKHFNLLPQMHQLEEFNYMSADQVCQLYGLKKFEMPLPDCSIGSKNHCTAGQLEFEILFTPGHSSGSISFYCPKEEVIFSGDVLFEGSIGRTDLPGGDYSTLIQSIQNKLLTLPSETQVYSGHGGVTTIGQEKATNPFLS